MEILLLPRGALTRYITSSRFDKTILLLNLLVMSKKSCPTFYLHGVSLIKSAIMKYYAAICLLSLSLFFVQCADDPVTPDNSVPEGRQSAERQDLGSANAVFGLDMFKEILANADAGKNVMISPMSIQTAMLMALNGANGDTYKAITNGLKTSDFSEESLNKAYHDHAADLESADQKTEISLANGLFWDEARMMPDEEFLQRMDQSFSAQRSGLDFSAPSTLDAINDWVKTNTNGKIESILEDISSDEVMFLINALYFKGDWSNPFPIGSTRDQPFYLSDGSMTNIPTMDLDANSIFYKGPDFEAVDLHFGDSAFSMTIMIPADATMTVDDMITDLTNERLALLYGSDLQSGRVQIKLPRFEIEYKQTLNDALKAMGMSIAFSQGGADFSRLGNAPEGNLHISRVEHKTFLKVDEKGAEGAAVTSVGVAVTSVPPTISFNRPFAIILRDVQHGSMLFIGKVEQP